MSGMLAFPKYFGLVEPGIIFAFGDSGVFFFFVLSGFIITLAHFDDVAERRDVRNFLIKRSVRIYPTYWLVFCGVYCAAAVVAPETLPDGLTSLRALSLTPMDPGVVGGTGAPVLAVAWTLQYEIIFYLIFALCYTRLWLGLCVGISFFAIYSFAMSDHVRTLPVSYGSLFALGVAVAVAIKSGWRLSQPWMVLLLAVLGLTLAAIAESLGGGGALRGDRTILYGLLFAATILALVCLEIKNPVPSGISSVMIWGGAISYSVYLIHFPLLSATFKLAVKLHFHGAVGGIAASISAIGLVLLLAHLLYHRFERPVLAAAKRKNAISTSPVLVT